MKNSKRISFVAAVIAPLVVQATDGTWSVDASGNWSNSANWASATVAQGVSAVASFTNAITTARVVTNDLASVSIGSINFASGIANGWTLTGNPLWLSVSNGSPTVTVSSASATIANRIWGNQGFVKRGAGDLWITGNATNTGAGQVLAGNLVISGGVVNASVGLAAGTSLTALWGNGLAGDYYYTGQAAIQSNFNTMTTIQWCESQLNPNLLFNGPASGTTFDFGNTGANFPQGVPNPNFEIRWEGKFLAPVSGTYYFGIASDDGSMLFIDGTIYIYNNYAQGVTLRGTNISLSAGLHDIYFQYQEIGGGYGFYADYALPASPTNRIPLSALISGPAIGSLSGAVGSVLNLSNGPITIAQSADGVFDGLVAGSNTLRKIGIAALSLTADNSAFTGGLLLEGGRVSAATDANIGGPNGAISFGGGILRVSGTAVTNLDARPVNWGSFIGGIDVATTGFAFVVTNVLGGAGQFAKYGSGSLLLTASNLHSGGISAAGGTLVIGANENMGVSSGQLSFNGGTVLVTTSFAFPAARMINMYGAGGIGVSAGQTLWLTNNFLTGANTLTKSDAGTLSIIQTSGTSGWTGPLIVGGGLMQIAGYGADATIRNNITVNSGATLQQLSANIIVNTSTITVNSGGLFDQNFTNSDAIAYLAGGGTITNCGGFTLDLGTTTNNFSGSIHGAGILALRGVNGAGTQILSGANYFTGGVLLQAGTLSVGQDSNLGVAGGAVNFSNGTLQVTGTALQNLDSRPVNWGSFNGALDIAAAGNVFTITNVIGGSGSLTKLGAGALVLASSNAYSGATTINNGILDIGPNGGISSTTIGLNGGTLLLENNGALNAGATLSANTGAKIYLTNGVGLTIATLNYNGIVLLNGTWGATGSGADHISDALFGGTGIILVTNGFAGAVADGSWATNSGAWGVSNNWNAGIIAYGTNSTAYFTNAITADTTVNNGYPLLDVGNLNFSSPTNNFNWIITNNTINLAVSPGFATVTVATNRATISSVLAGGNGLIKAGNGTLALTASNTISGNAMVNAGVVNLQNSGSLGAIPAATISSGARVELQNNITISGKTNTIFGQGGNSLGGLQNALGTNAWTGTVVLGDVSARIGVNTGVLAVGTITDNGANYPLTVKGQSAGSGTVVLSSTNSYGANTEIFAVTLKSGGNNSVNPVQSLSNRSFAATFDLAGFNQTLNGVGVANDGGFLTITNSSTNAASTLTITNAGVDNFSAGVIATTVTVVKAGGGTQMFGPVNGFPTVPLQVNEGTVVLSGSAFNHSLSLASGSTLVAANGPGLVGEYYPLTIAPVTTSFNNPQILSGHLGSTNASLLFNYPVNGFTSFDFGNVGSSGIYFPYPFNSIAATNNEVRWRGKFTAPTNGTYYFATASDDGSMLWVDGTQVVNNNAYQGTTLKSGTILLTAGMHDIEIAYYEGGGGYNMYADVALPGGTTNRLSTSLVSCGPAVMSLSGPAGSTIILSNTTLLVSQTNNTSFDGQITGVGAIRKLSWGTLTLTGSNAQTNNILGGGRLSVSTDANLGGANSGVTFDGGLLQITGTAISNLASHSVNWNSFIGGFDIANVANTFVVTNNIIAPAANSSLWKIGPGTLPMIGNVVTNSGGAFVQGPMVLNNSYMYNGGLTLVQTGSLAMSGSTITNVGQFQVQQGTIAMSGSTLASPAAISIWQNSTVVLTNNSLIREAGMNIGSVNISMYDNSQITNSANVVDNIGNNPGESATLVMRGNSRFARTTNTLSFATATNSACVVTLADNAQLLAGHTVPMFVGNAGRATLTIQDNAYISNRIDVGFANFGAGAMYQRGGTVFNSDSPGADGVIGWNFGSYGYYGLFAGAHTNRSWGQVSWNGLGVWQQFGGSFVHLNLDGGQYDISRGGTGILYVANGTWAAAGNVNIATANGGGSGGGLGVVTFDNSSFGAVTGAVTFCGLANMTGQLNLNGNSVLAANQLSKVGALSGTYANLNFNGGTLRALAAGNLINVGANAMNSVYIYGNGATIDTLANNVTIAQPLLAPSNNGVTSIPVLAQGSNYIGSPVVIISGGGGTGATAVAMMDFITNSPTFGQMTNILITSPGVNYTSAPSVALYGGAPMVSGTVGVATIGANLSGGLTKLGSGTLTLAATNTYGGTTTIGNGTILVGSTNSIPGMIVLATNTAGVGPTYTIDQNFISWLTSRIVGGTSPGIILLGSNSAANLDFTIFTNTSLGAGNGTWTYSGNLTIPGTNLYLGNGNGTLVYAPNIGTGTNVFIGYNGAVTFPAIGAVQLNGTNAGYASTINVVSGTLKSGLSNSLGGAAAVINIANGATLDVNASYIGDATVNVIGSGVNANGAIINSGVDVTPAMTNVHLLGNTTFGGTGRWDIRANTTGPILDLAGYTMTKTNANVVDAFNCQVTDGNIIIGQGMFRLEQAASATAGVGRITIGPAGTLDYWSFTGDSTRSITLNGGTISVGSGVANVGSAVTLSGATNSFTPSPSTMLVLTGLVDGAGAAQKNNSGTLKLINTETYSGATIVGGGTLELAAPASGTIPSSSALIVTNGGIVQVDYANGIFGAASRPITINSGVLSTSNGISCNLDGSLSFSAFSLISGTPDGTFGSWSLATNIPVGAPSSISAQRVQLANPAGVTFDVTNGSILQASGSLEDPSGSTGTLVKAGAGTLVVSGTNTYGGPTVIKNGTLKLSAVPLAPVGGAAIWLDAADASTITRDTNNAISQWSDKSGRSRNATQAVQANKPAFVTNALLNGKTVVRFGGGTQIMDVDFSFLANSGYTIFGIEGRTNTGNVYFLGTRNASANNGLHFGYRNNTDFALAQYGNDIDYTGIAGYTTQQFRLWDGMLDLYSGHSLWLNGTNVASSANTQPFLTTLGAGCIGYGYGGSTYFFGDLGEIIIYNRTLTTLERQQVEAYLKAKWLDGIPAGAANLLPANTTVQLASGAILDLGGVSQTIGSLSDLSGGGGLVTNSASAGATFSIGNDNANTTFSGSIRDGAGSVALAKIGTGIQTLNGISTFSGGTAISGGSLIVNGALIGTGGVTFASGTLGGTGIVNGFVINMGGTVAPGASPGRLTILGDYATAGSLDIEIAGNVAGSGYDQLLVGGSASLGGTLNVTLTNYTPVAGDSFTILTASNGLNGTTFGAEILPALTPPTLGWQVQYLPNTVVLSVTSAPTGYDAWAAQIVGTNTAYNQSALGDGYPNLLKYATGSSPTTPDNLANMSGARLGGILQLLFNHDTNATDISLIVEGAYTSTNDATWNGIATNIAGSWGSATNVVENTATNPASVTVSDTVGPSTNRFLRLRVTRP